MDLISCDFFLKSVLNIFDFVPMDRCSYNLHIRTIFHGPGFVSLLPKIHSYIPDCLLMNLVSKILHISTTSDGPDFM